MIKNEQLRIWVNRILAFAVGGLLVFLIMNLSVVSSNKNQIEELKEDLDEWQYGAERLLENAKAFLEDRNYWRAKETLDTLSDRHPSSDETAEGEKLYPVVLDSIEREQEEQEQMDTKWEAAVEAIQRQWQIEKAAELREQLEEEMDDTLDKEWGRVGDTIRKEWEEQQ